MEWAGMEWAGMEWAGVEWPGDSLDTCFMYDRNTVHRNVIKLL